MHNVTRTSFLMNVGDHCYRGFDIVGHDSTLMTHTNGSAFRRLSQTTSATVVCRDDLAHLQTTASTMVVKMTWHTFKQTIASAMVVCRDDFGASE